MAFENEALMEKAPVLPDTVRFDSVFSNDLAEEQDFDLCFGAEEDDELISMVSQNELFTEAGYEIPYVTLNEEDEDDDEDNEKDFDDAADNTSSSDVESSDEDKEGDENMLEDPEEGSAPDENDTPAPTVQVNVDADDVNINAEAPANEEANLLDLDEDEVEISNAQTVNIIHDPADKPADNTEPATAPVPATNDDVEVSSPAAVEPDTAEGEPENLLDDPAGDDSEDDTEAPEDEGCCKEANMLEDDGGYNPFIDRANLAQTNVYVGNQEDEIPGTTDTPNLLEADDGDPTTGEAPSGNKEMDKTPDPEHKDTSKISGMSDEKFEKDKTDAMSTVDDLGFSEANLLEADEDPQENATEDDGAAALDVAVTSNMLGGVEGVESVWNGIDVRSYNDGSAAAAQDSVPNLLEAEVSDDYSDIAKIDNEDKFHDDLEDVGFNRTPSTMNNLPVDSTKKEEGIDTFKDTENDFEDNTPKQCPVKTMNNSPEDSTKKELGIENDKTKASQNDFDDDLYGVTTADVSKIINNAPEDTSKVDEANLLEEDDEEIDGENATEIGNSSEDVPTDECSEANLLEEDDTEIDGENATEIGKSSEDVPTDECSEANLLEEDEEGKYERGILQADTPSDDTSMYAAIEKDPEFPKKDADFSEFKEANLLEDDAETNFEDIADKNSTPADSYEVTPDVVAVPAEDRDPDGLKAEVNGPIENGDDELVAPTHEDANLLEIDYEDQVEAISSDNVFYDTINKGLQPPVNLLDVDDEDTVDDKTIDEV